VTTVDDIVRKATEVTFNKPLVTNVFRSVLVEAIVAAALSDWDWCSRDYASCDFRHPDSTRLEVKQSAARQTWFAGHASRASWDIRPRAGYWGEDRVGPPAGPVCARLRSCASSGCQQEGGPQGPAPMVVLCRRGMRLAEDEQHLRGRRCEPHQSGHLRRTGAPRQSTANLYSQIKAQRAIRVFKQEFAVMNAEIWSGLAFKHCRAMARPSDGWPAWLDNGGRQSIAVGWMIYSNLVG
jgi:hypothetical protein